MGLHLFVWHETKPLSADEARSKVDRWAAGDTGVFARHPEVAAFLYALVEKFPASDPLGVWKSMPPPSDQVVAISCTWLGAALVAQAAAELATEHGLVCYEPRSHILNPNAPGYVPEFVLTGAGAPAIPDPDAQRLDWAVRRLNDRNYYAILDRADGRFAQVGYGPSAGLPAGTWALEYEEDGLHATRTTDVAEAVQFLQDYLAEDSGWRERHTWQRLTFG
jgi:hypothetical protein